MEKEKCVDMKIGDCLELKRTLRKPYPIKGAWSEFGNNKIICVSFN